MRPSASVDAAHSGRAVLSTSSDRCDPAPSRSAWLNIAVVPDAVSADNAPPADTLRLPPSLLTALLKHELAAVGRVWLLARHLNENGQGWISVADLRTALTGKNSPLRVCGWRRLRQILQQGKGTFWERDDLGRLWLFGLTRVAALLDVQHFAGDAVRLPIADLLGGIGSVHSSIYSAFHCGRDSTPISRATLCDITGVPERTQRLYDTAHNTERVANFSLCDENQSETVWQHGRAVFSFIDRLGKQGGAGSRYTAIRLPNSYISTRYERIPTKRKRLNRKLKQDLAKYGTRGNKASTVQRLFFVNAKQAGRVFGREQDVYLRQQQQASVVFWTGWKQ